MYVGIGRPGIAEIDPVTGNVISSETFFPDWGHRGPVLSMTESADGGFYLMMRDSTSFNVSYLYMGKVFSGNTGSEWIARFDYRYFDVLSMDVSPSGELFGVLSKNAFEYDSWIVVIPRDFEEARENNFRFERVNLTGNDNFLPATISFQSDGAILSFGNLVTASGNTHVAAVIDPNTFEIQSVQPVSQHVRPGFDSRGTIDFTPHVPDDPPTTQTGGAGNDVLQDQSGPTHFIGGRGIDTVTYAQAGAGVVVDLNSGGAGGAAGDTFLGIENLVGSVLNDTIRGTNGPNVIEAGRGADGVFAEGGNDTLLGGLGADALDGGAGSDFVDYRGSSVAVTVNLVSGIGRGGHAAGDRLRSIEHLIGSPRGDQLTGNDRANTLDGGLGHDRLFGGAGRDVVRGGPGNDRLFGGGGNDSLSGGDGTDTLKGGTGEDVLQGENQDDQLFGDAGNDLLLAGAGVDTLYGGLGADTLRGGSGGDSLFGQGDVDRLFGEAGNDRMFGGNGDDRLVGGDGADLLRGGGGADRLVGKSMRDRLFGQNGDDQLFGGNGDDRLYGGVGDDTLGGGQGRDRLFGGAGDDSLIGGAGGDTFIFEDRFGDDTVIGFNALTGAEKIDLSAVAGITSFADLQANHLGLVGGEVTITDGTDTITLLGVNLGDLGGNDFVF